MKKSLEEEIKKVKMEKWRKIIEAVKESRLERWYNLSTKYLLDASVLYPLIIRLREIIILKSICNTWSYYLWNW